MARRLATLAARLRYRFLRDPASRRALERLPGGGRIADRHREALFELLAGASRTQAMVAGLDSGAIDALAEGPCRAEAIAVACGLSHAGTGRLLEWLEGAGLIETIGGARHVLTVEGLVLASDPGVRAMVRHGRLLYDDLSAPLDLVDAPGSGRVAQFWPYRDSDGKPGDYARLMRESLGFCLDSLLAAVDFTEIADCCEIGGGEGALAIALADRFPHMALAVVELPTVVPHARAAIAEAGLASHIAVGQTSEFDGRRFDRVVLMRLLHDLDDGAAAALLRQAFAMVRAGGAVVIAEPVARRGRDAQTAYFAAYFLAMGSGRLRHPEEIERLVASATAASPRFDWNHNRLCSVLKIRQDRPSK